ncbi:unnamed protein product [Pleuronectes platessa]|uniref:Uncharacterized protein n=1 Tax=Pleuronectes platessa TaxID=8262 RepID=A0A9N7TLQ6_PLEPL|nr:unnamed protein product [Pleuronectes platessa]
MGNGGFPQQHRTACEKQVVKKQQQTQNPEVFSSAGDAWHSPPIDPHIPAPPIDPHIPAPPIDFHIPAPPIDPHIPAPPIDPHIPVPPIDPHIQAPPIDPHIPAPPIDPHIPAPPINPHIPAPPSTGTPADHFIRMKRLKLPDPCKPRYSPRKQTDLSCAQGLGTDLSSVASGCRGQSVGVLFKSSNAEQLREQLLCMCYPQPFEARLKTSGTKVDVTVSVTSSAGLL